jgi:hypothetical protein
VLPASGLARAPDWATRAGGDASNRVADRARLTYPWWSSAAFQLRCGASSVWPSSYEVFQASGGKLIWIVGARKRRS